MAAVCQGELSVSSVEQLQREARLAVRANDTDRAVKLNEQLAAHNLPEGHLGCGWGYEIYAWQKNDPSYYDKAWYHYFKLMTDFDASEGYVGCARIILAREDAAKADTAVRYCHYAIERDRNPFAYLVLGRVYEQFFLPEKVKPALRAYWQSAWRGAAFGMRRYANLHWRHGSKTVAIVVHIVATVLFPLFRLFGGSRALRPG